MKSMMQNKNVEVDSNQEEEFYDVHKRLCEELNMDGTATELSWQSYKSIRFNFKLNGNQTHWLCCSIFVACKKSVTPTVGNESSTLEGNCVSLTRLLRICNISIYDFFQKIKQWMEMASSPESFRTKVNQLKHGFAVSVVLYRKFGPIFEDLFICAKTEERVKSNKKSKPLPCSATKLYELAWCLFVSAKAECPHYNDDLVKSFHILLCCCDLIYANVINEKRTDLINPKFSGLPSNWNSDEFDPQSAKSLCIVAELCQIYGGDSLDALHAKTYILKPVMEKFFAQKILRGDSDTFLNIIAPGNFDMNLKSLNNVYETYVLTLGEVDERIFLKHFQFGSRNFGANGTAAGDVDETIQSLVPQTPLTGTSNVDGSSSRRARDPVAPLAIAHNNISKLRVTFGSYDGNLPAGIKDLVDRNDGETIIAQLQDRLTKMKAVFIGKSRNAEQWNIVEALYYHLLQNIVESELKIRPKLDIKLLLCEEQIQQTLIVCCVEIVCYSYNPQRWVPTVLQWYKMHPFKLYKIIEIVVLNHQDSLTRDIIKHLNVIEEQILESYAWESASPLWDRIKDWAQPIPLCQDIDKPKMIGDYDLAGITPHNPHFRKPDNGDNKKLELGTLVSPSRQSVKKQLFETEKPTAEANVEPESAKMSILSSQESGQSSQGDALSQSSQDDTNHLLASTKKSTRGASLLLFFRKFYKLASVRIKSLFKELGLNDQELLKKIWTVFEFSIREQTDLMKDRHLDQMIMCAIYVIFRVTKINKTFKDIMTQYRNQPQWGSHVYRSILIEQRNDGTNVGEQKGSPEKQTKERYEPGDLAGTSQRYENEERGDIIKFYNTVYVKKMQQFVMKFFSKESLLLSPLPPNQIMSPKKISEHHSVYIQSLGKNLLKSPSPAKSITYEFTRSPIKESPSKGLVEINRIVNQTRSTKRHITDDFGDDNPFQGQLPKVPKKLEYLISHRQEENKK